MVLGFFVVILGLQWFQAYIMQFFCVPEAGNKDFQTTMSILPTILAY